MKKLMCKKTYESNQYARYFFENCLYDIETILPEGIYMKDSNQRVLLFEFDKLNDYIWEYFYTEEEYKMIIRQKKIQSL